MALRLDRDVETRLRSIAGNNVCVDCETKSPQWASVSFGVFMCLECSGRHRGLGVHISFVRSVTMDSWTEKQIKFMEMGGNDKLNNFLLERDIAKNVPIEKKYNCNPAKLYKERLSAEVEGRPLPTAIVSSVEDSTTPQSSEPLPGETEADYVARQRKLQEEARERMRKKFGSSSGLSSSGKMQGIGSQYNGSNAGNERNNSGYFSTPLEGMPDLKLNEISQNIFQASNQAFSFVSSSLVGLSDQVNKVYQESMHHESSPPNTSDISPQNSFPAGNDDETTTSSQYRSPLGVDMTPISSYVNQEQLTRSWNMFSTQALSFWEQASSATFNTVNQISKQMTDGNDWAWEDNPNQISDPDNSIESSNDLLEESDRVISEPRMHRSPASSSTTLNASSIPLNTSSSKLNMKDANNSDSGKSVNHSNSRGGESTPKKDILKPASSVPKSQGSSAPSDGDFFATFGL